MTCYFISADTISVSACWTLNTLNCIENKIQTLGLINLVSSTCMFSHYIGYTCSSSISVPHGQQCRLYNSKANKTVHHELQITCSITEKRLSAFTIFWTDIHVTHWNCSYKQWIAKAKSLPPNLLLWLLFFFHLNVQDDFF